MTGFGSAREEVEEGAVSAEVRSVNSRHLKVSLRLPSGCEEWEPGLRERVSQCLSRGRVTVTVEATREGNAPPPLELDEDRVESCLTAFRRIREEYALPGQVDLPLLVRAGGLLRERPRPASGWLDEEAVEAAVEAALEELVAMRVREGKELERDLRSRIEAIRGRVERVRELAPIRLERERERLRGSVRELIGELDDRLDDRDEDRIAREIALLADRWDVGEEGTRAAAHLDAFEDFLERGSAEPIGKRLDFVAQELHREINTMGAKANDPKISREVVEMKNELESIREQVENVE